MALFKQKRIAGSKTSVYELATHMSTSTPGGDTTNPHPQYLLRSEYSGGGSGGGTVDLSVHVNDPNAHSIYYVKKEAISATLENTSSKIPALSLLFQIYQELINKLTGKSGTDHTHTAVSIGAANAVHNHDGVYMTVAERNSYLPLSNVTGTISTSNAQVPTVGLLNTYVNSKIAEASSNYMQTSERTNYVLKTDIATTLSNSTSVPAAVSLVNSLQIAFSSHNHNELYSVIGHIHGEYLSVSSLNNDAEINIYVATTGDDTNGNGTEAAPFATIARALTYLQSLYVLKRNFIIHLAAGNYETQRISLVSDYEKISIIGDGSSSTTITLQPISENNYASSVFLIQIGKASIQNVTLQGPGASINSNAVVSSSDATTYLHNCVLTGWNAGIFADETSLVRLGDIDINNCDYGMLCWHHAVIQFDEAGVGSATGTVSFSNITKYVYTALFGGLIESRGDFMPTYTNVGGICKNHVGFVSSGGGGVYVGTDAENLISRYIYAKPPVVKTKTVITQTNGTVTIPFSYRDDIYIADIGSVASTLAFDFSALGDYYERVFEFEIWVMGDGTISFPTGCINLTGLSSLTDIAYDSNDLPSGVDPLLTEVVRVFKIRRIRLGTDVNRIIVTKSYTDDGTGCRNTATEIT